MKTIRILSESAAVGMRLREILYQAGYADILLSDLSAMPAERQDSLLMIYAKTHIASVMQNAADSGCPVVLLLNPDCYAMYLDRARYLGITLLLMPAAPYMLLDAVQNAIS
ncbi:MAG: hypothetical protein IKH27_08150 [Oscillospiraceae bacterium]|nr:hypothetical protein [Oscillospiraceae bacterium]